MSDSTRLGRARGTAPGLAAVAAALLALLVAAPSASAATSPVADGSTTLTVSEGFATKLQKAEIRLALVKPSSFRGNTVRFPVSGGELRPSDGKGTVIHGGGLKFRSAKKSVTLKRFTISTASRSLSVRVGGRTIKFARFVDASVARLGFGDSIATKRLKLTGAGARALKKVAPVFRSGIVIGSTLTEVEPTTVGVESTGSIAFGADAGLLGKLSDVGVEVQTIAPTTVAGTNYTSWIDGGSISPFGDSGSVDSSGGIKLVQNLQGGPSSTVTLGSFDIEIGGKTASAEVIGESNAETEGRRPLNLGSPGRTSVADLTFGSITPSPATRTVAIGASATLQVPAAEVLEGFVKIFQAYYAGTASATLQKEINEGKKPAMSEAEIKAAGAKAAEAKAANDQIRPGDALGSFSLVATGE